MAKAVVCSEHGLPDKLNLVTDWETPELGPNDVRMDVKAAGLNFPDVLIIQGKYQMQPPMPFVPGGESAGVVTEVGSAVTRWSVGDSVIQLGGVGGFASEAVVNENALLPKPDGIDFTAAAGVGMTYFTSYYALKQRGQLKAGETMLVMGAAGGVGSTAVAKIVETDGIYLDDADQTPEAIAANWDAIANSEPKQLQAGFEQTFKFLGKAAQAKGISLE